MNKIIQIISTVVSLAALVFTSYNVYSGNSVNQQIGEIQQEQGKHNDTVSKHLEENELIQEDIDKLAEENERLEELVEYRETFDKTFETTQKGIENAELIDTTSEKETVNGYYDEIKEQNVSLSRMKEISDDLVSINRDVREKNAAKQEQLTKEEQRQHEQETQEPEPTVVSEETPPQSQNKTTDSEKTPPPAQPQPKPSANSGTSVYDKARAILNKHGCHNVGIVIDDPRIQNYQGAADWYNNTVLIGSQVGNRLNYIAAHECAHMKQYAVYNGDVATLKSDMDKIYGSPGWEQNADCITQHWGYSQWNYTANCSGARGQAAQAISNGRRP